jgi:hypothetical protein
LPSDGLAASGVPAMSVDSGTCEGAVGSCISLAAGSPGSFGADGGGVSCRPTAA